MKTMRAPIATILVLGLIAGAGSLGAQDMTQEEYVLQQVRDKLKGKTEAPASETPSTVPSAPATSAESPAPSASNPATSVEDFWKERDAATKTVVPPKAPESRGERREILPIDDRQAQAASEAEPALDKDTFVIEVVPGIPDDLSGYEVNMALGIVGSGLGATDGAQVSSVFNLNGRVKGFQAAGVFNIAHGEVLGFQAAGVFNLTMGHMRGFQSAGVFNLGTGDLDGFQSAGVLNLAKRVNGFQASGLVNIAETVYGGQIGLVNIAKEHYGLGIGLINLSQNGIHQAEFSWSDNDMVRLGFKLGTPINYTHFYAEMANEDIMVSRDSLVLGMNLGFRFSGNAEDANEGGLYLDLEAGAKYHVGSRDFAWDPSWEDKCHQDLSDEEAKARARQYLEENRQYFAFDASATLGLRFGDHLGIFGGVGTTFAAVDKDHPLGEGFTRGQSFSTVIGDTLLDGRTRWYFGLSL